MKVKELTKKIIMLNHPGMTYEEALLEELVFGCLIKLISFGTTGCVTYNLGIFTVNDIKKSNNEYCPQEISLNWHGKIIPTSASDCIIEGITRGSWEILGLPITIGRVMVALNTLELSDMDNIILNTGDNECLISIEHGDYYESSTYSDICTWILQVKGREATLEDQSEETIDGLLKILS